MTAEPHDITVAASRQADRLVSTLKSGALALKPQARKAAKKLAQTAKPVANHVRQRPVLYIASALLVGAGISLLASKKTRGAVGSVLRRTWDMAGDTGGKAAKRLRAKLH